MLKMWRKKTLTNGRQLFIHETPGDKGTIIGVHGLTGNHMQLGHYQKAFEKQYRMITYDLRGRGKSSEADLDTSIERHVEDLVELIDLLKVDRPILMGYSMGAYICLRVASKINVGGLILLDGAEESGEMEELMIPSLMRMRNSYQSRLDYIQQTREILEKYGVRWSEHLNRIANYDIEKQGKHWKHKSNAQLIKKDLISCKEFIIDEHTTNIAAPVLHIKAIGHTRRRPSYKKRSYINLTKYIKNVEVIKTKANYVTLIFNKQAELEWKMLDFLSRVVENQASDPSYNRK